MGLGAKPTDAAYADEEFDSHRPRTPSDITTKQVRRILPEEILLKEIVNVHKYPKARNKLTILRNYLKDNKGLPEKTSLLYHALANIIKLTSPDTPSALSKDDQNFLKSIIELLGTWINNIAEDPSITNFAHQSDRFSKQHIILLQAYKKAHTSQTKPSSFVSSFCSIFTNQPNALETAKKIGAAIINLRFSGQFSFIPEEKETPLTPTETAPALKK